MVTPQRLEIIRTQATEEISKMYKERFHKQGQEVEEYRMLCNQLKHTLAFTQSEYETQKAEYQRIVEEYKLSAEAEVIWNYGSTIIKHRHAFQN